jgi:carboxyl-terminal processing protease
MKKTIRQFSARALLLLLALSLLLSFSACTEKPPAETEPQISFNSEDLMTLIGLVDFNKLNQVEEIFEKYYIGEYKPYKEVDEEVINLIIENVDISKIDNVDDATTVFIGAYLDVLGDKYAYYYDAEAFEEYNQDSEGEYVGIGISVVITEDNYIEAITVFKDGPADKAGILPGDILTKVDGVDIAELGYYESIERVRGEKGTNVKITLLRDGEELEFDVIRDKVTEITVEYELMQDNIGYIRITSFDDKTYDQFYQAYNELSAQGAKGLLFDVRNNPGGRLDAVVAILEYILPEGNIVHMEYKDSSRNYSISTVLQCNPLYFLFHKFFEDHKIDMPMVVLTNENTASAGELFTSSLKDYSVATIIGEKTYGKGVGQTGFNLKDINGKEDGSAVTITYFYYAPPFSENYDGIGIQPHKTVSLSEEAKKKNIHKLTFDEDTQLQAGLLEIATLIANKNAMSPN